MVTEPSLSPPPILNTVADCPGPAVRFVSCRVARRAEHVTHDIVIAIVGRQVDGVRRIDAAWVGAKQVIAKERVRELVAVDHVAADTGADVSLVQIIFHTGIVLVGHAYHPVQGVRGIAAVVIGVVDRKIVGVHRAERRLHHHRRDDVLQDVVVNQVVGRHIGLYAVIHRLALRAIEIVALDRAMNRVHQLHQIALTLAGSNQAHALDPIVGRVDHRDVGHAARVGRIDREIFDASVLQERRRPPHGRRLARAPIGRIERWVDGVRAAIDRGNLDDLHLAAKDIVDRAAAVAAFERARRRGVVADEEVCADGRIVGLIEMDILADGDPRAAHVRERDLVRPLRVAARPIGVVRAAGERARVAAPLVGPRKADARVLVVAVGGGRENEQRLVCTRASQRDTGFHHDAGRLKWCTCPH